MPFNLCSKEGFTCFLYTYFFSNSSLFSGSNFSFAAKFTRGAISEGEFTIGVPVSRRVFSASLDKFFTPAKDFEEGSLSK